MEIIRSRGYVCTIYQVTTEDGYILELHRIGLSNGRPVLLQHGLLSTDVDWITNPSTRSLGEFTHYRLIGMIFTSGPEMYRLSFG